LIYARIAGTGSFLPERIVTNAEMEKLVETSDEWIASRTGIRQRHIAADGQTTCDLAFGAATAALEAAGVKAKDIDLLIVGTTTPDLIFPSTACLLQHRLGANGCAAFDVNAACSGFIYALTVLNVMALITFMVYPAAPPWYVYQHGFGQPPHSMLDSSGSLVNFDKIVGRRMFVSFYNTFNSNLFAAIPSLHSGYPTTIAISLWWRLRGRTWLWVVYPLVAWFAAVYLNHHYIIDLVIGSAYSLVAFAISRFVLIPYVFDRFVDYDVTSRQQFKTSFDAKAQREAV